MDCQILQAIRSKMKVVLLQSRNSHGLHVPGPELKAAFNLLKYLIDFFVITRDKSKPECQERLRGGASTPTIHGLDDLSVRVGGLDAVFRGLKTEADFQPRSQASAPQINAKLTCIPCFLKPISMLLVLRPRPCIITGIVSGAAQHVLPRRGL